MQLIDTHAHLDEDAFDDDRDDVIARAIDAGLQAIICIGTTAADSRAAVELAGRHESVFAAVGIQPNYVGQSEPADWDVIEQLAAEPKVVAIGETGLDRYWDYTPFDQQIDYFDRHIELSRRHGLPFVVHCREAEADVVSQLIRAAQAGSLAGVMHSFCGSAETATSCLDLGLFISFAGMLTFRKNKSLRAVAAGIPRDRLLIETDAPYLAPTPHRGQRNEPAFVIETNRSLAQTHEVSAEEMAAITTTNARTLFKV